MCSKRNKQESGQSAIEYILLVAVMFTVIISVTGFMEKGTRQFLLGFKHSLQQVIRYGEDIPKMSHLGKRVKRYSPSGSGNE